MWLCLSLCRHHLTPACPYNHHCACYQELLDFVVWAFVGIGALTVANVVNDRVLMRGYLNTPSLLQGNMATGLVEMGQFVGSGETCLPPRLSPAVLSLAQPLHSLSHSCLTSALLQP